MIAELFYPKELNEIIEDLRQKDDLNEEALKNINRLPKTLFIMWFSFSLLIIVVSPLNFFTTLIFTIICGSLTAAYLPIRIKVYFEHSMASYIHGDLRKGTVEDIVTNGISPGGSSISKFILINDEKQQSLVETASYVEFCSPEYKNITPKKGSSIQFFLSDNLNYKATLNTQPFLKSYCLSKTLTKGKSYE